ncbi:MAG: hypothetical protein OQK99_03185 [Gammaproteobacteria bacterium]|jgi:hypothetical protein|nr:hypothetical protein [Gammaproteobacteria bacterium]
MNRWILTAVAFLVAPALAQAQVTGNAFNPAISLILDGKFSSYSGDLDGYDFAGFPLDPEIGPPPEGLSLGESELVLSSNIDDQFYGFMTVALGDSAEGTEVSVEEAWIQTLALPAGFSVKAGKMLSGIGYHNSQHAHAWDYVDAPLPYQVMLGGALGDAGIQVRWVAPTDLLLELGAEVLRGDSYPAAGAGDSGTGTWTAFAHLGGDLGASNSWRVGLSRVSFDVAGRSYDLGADQGGFYGSGSVDIVDGIWKWAENGNTRARTLVVQAEYLKRREDGRLDVTGDTLNGTSPYAIAQDGFYVQGAYQFRPMWRLGLRYERIHGDNADLQPPLNGLLDTSGSPDRVTAMLDYSHSEFSRLRFQVASLDNGQGSESQVFLQYIMSLGAHGAHQF